MHTINILKLKAENLVLEKRKIADPVEFLNCKMMMTDNTFTKRLVMSEMEIPR